MIRARARIDLQPRHTPGAAVEEVERRRWMLRLPAGTEGHYRLAQLDDYTPLARCRFRWQAPLRLELRARLSQIEHLGTWGFGFWNDPFSLNLGVKGAGRRLPALPNAAWFFYASHPNYLALRDDHPADGLLASVFASRALPAGALAIALPFAPLLALPPLARLARRLARFWVGEDAFRLSIDPCGWHTYRLEVAGGKTRFAIDGQLCFTTSLWPPGRLGLVIWIDNQFAAFRPDGRLRFGALATPQAAWMEIESLHVAGLEEAERPGEQLEE